MRGIFINTTEVVDGQVVLTSKYYAKPLQALSGEAPTQIGRTVLTEGVGENHTIKRRYQFEIEGSAFIDLVHEPGPLNKCSRVELEYALTNMHWDSVVKD